MEFDIKKFHVKKYDSILERGLSLGLGIQGEQVCIEAAICETLGLDHGDDPGCVASSVRAFKIALNDAPWSTPKARAQGLRALGLAQLGSLGVVNDVEFTIRLSKKIISVLIPKIFRQSLSEYPECLSAAKQCEDEGTFEAARSAESVARSVAEAAEAAEAAKWAAAEAAKWAAAAAKWAAWAESEALSAESAESAARSAARSVARSVAEAAEAAKWAAKWPARAEADAYLILAGTLALETLRELNSPGINLL